jgi:protein-disulfide isomerase
MSNKNLLIFIGVVIFAFIALVVYSKQQTANAPGSQGSSNVYGKADSKVTLTEYVDFQCEGCLAYYPNVKTVKEAYKDTVRFEIKNFPISSSHQNALAAASAAQAAAKQGKFFEMHDKLFDTQKEWESSEDRVKMFEGYAEEIGLNMDQFRKDYSSKETSAIVRADLKEVQALGGEGTPTFALNGRKIETPENTVEALSAVLDKALEQSK